MTERAVSAQDSTQVKKQVTLTIDGIDVTVPEGTLIVNAAKTVGIDIPVFCYHPKMEPVGMCRMCLVEIGRPVIDRTTGQVMLNEDGSPKIQFGAKLETSCTTPVSEGMVVLGMSEKAKTGRKDIIEFILTSHPLDCPICDKGGECPLQNLTMAFGPGESRYIYEEKKRLAKHVPLGEMIFLDRERCIQCGRCVRFQDLIVDDPVIGFAQRGRSLEIVTYSEPGFDSYFSGNTTDICPVGALTTADFRFGARPWELKSAASICSHCPVGCNLTYNVRREAVAGTGRPSGDVVIKRAMPRQNEQVNEIWICDKGRFSYHYTERPNRLLQPLIRRGGSYPDGSLEPASWDEALDLVAGQLKTAGGENVTIVGGRLSNEDLFNLKALTDELKGRSVLYSSMAGGDLVAQVGVGKGTNFSDLGEGTAILVVASDLEEEAPIWWLRVKQAAERGAKLIVANPRSTKLDRFANFQLCYPYGSEAEIVLEMVNSLSAKRPSAESRNLPDSGQLSIDRRSQLRREQVRTLLRSSEFKEAVQTFVEAENAIVIYGSEGTGLDASTALAQACANLLIATDHIGKSNNGLLAVWQRANDQGAWDMGFRPMSGLPGKSVLPGLDTDNQEVEPTTSEGLPKALYLVAVDPVGDDPRWLDGITGGNNGSGKVERPFVIVQELALTRTAEIADVVLPVQPYSEREGSFTSGERRVQRFYPAVPEHPGSKADFQVTAEIASRLGVDLEGRVASKVMEQIRLTQPDYAGVTYQTLSEVTQQWPIIGREDLFYGGTSYGNSQGLGFQLMPAAQRGVSVPLGWHNSTGRVNMLEGDEPENQISGRTDGQVQLLAVPVTRLYDQGSAIRLSPILNQRLGHHHVIINPQDAAAIKARVAQTETLKVEEEDSLKGMVKIEKLTVEVSIGIDANVPAGIAIVPRSMGIPVFEPVLIFLERFL